MIKIVEKGNIEKELLLIDEARARAFGERNVVVGEIIDAVRIDKDKALIKYTKKFDGLGISAKDLKVTKKEIDEAYSIVEASYKKALKAAIRNITDFHQKQKADEWFETLPNDVVIGMRNTSIERVGVYVPAGTAAYPSSVLMNVIPAKVAGVKNIVMISPPIKQGRKVVCNPYILVAAAELGIDNIYKVGGAQGIAALAFGTETVPRVDKIVGPGNIYVTIAKKMLYGIVGIDKPAGPSDIMIIADKETDPVFVAADMLSQAEHDPESKAVLVTDSKEIASKVSDEISRQIEKLGRKDIVRKALRSNGIIFLTKDMKEAVDIANRIAPEHLEILASNPQSMLEKINNAGAVFLGPYSPVAVGDYIAGPNHVLPTDGAARFSSPLGVYDFIKKQSIIGYTKPALKSVLQDIKVLASIEGLDAHVKSVEIRFK